MKKILILFLTLILCTPSISVLANSTLISSRVRPSAVDQKDTKKDAKKEPVKEKTEEKINQSLYDSVHLGKLLKNPTKYLKKNIRFRGEFSSFVTLALDYKPAYRSSKEYISFAIFRPKTRIPLSELKLAFPVEKAKDNKTLSDLGKGDLIEVYGSVFSDALGEPWVDVILVKMLKPAKHDKKKSKKDGDEKEKEIK